MEKKTITLSVALAVYNESSTIEACLDAIKDIADEIIIVDGGSTDDTVVKAKTYGAHIIETDNPPIFHINKQKALDACHGTWILQLDADEVVTEKLAREIGMVTSDGLRVRENSNASRANTQPSDINGYYIPRRNYFWGHWMRKGGQYPDYVIRLVRRGKAMFPCKSVHEQIAIDGVVGYLKEPLLHYSYRTTADYWKKADAYTSLTAKEFAKKQIRKTIGNWFYFTVWKFVQTFFSLYIRHKGCMDGWHGLVFAYWSALHYPIAWRKYTRNVSSI